MSSNIGDGNSNGDDSNVVGFPQTPEERRALRKAKQDIEKRKLINVFIDEAGGDTALFRTPDGVSYADLIVNGHRETWPIRSRQFRAYYLKYLQRQLERLVNEESVLAMAMRAAIRKTAVNAAIDDFETRASCVPTMREVFVRVAGHKDELYIDLCNDAWEVVRVTAAGWSVVESPPVRFRRSDAMLSLPFPKRGGKIDALRPFLNVMASDFVLIVAYVLQALYPRGPYPPLIPYGEQGTAKTTLLRRLRRLIDPHAVETAALPPTGRDLFISARNSHLLTFENLSRLSDQMSDHICRLATGGGYRIRKMFKDSDEVYFRGARPIAFEGIINVVTKPDLQDRSIILELEFLPTYKTEAELDAEFERQRPGIFGALLDMMVRGLEMRPVTRLVSPPRMADFATWSVACGLDQFEAAYAANRQNAINVMLSFDSVARAVRELMATRKVWTGITQELLAIVGPATGIKAPRKLSDELRRLATPLRTVGIYISYEPRTATERRLRIERRK